MNEHRQIIRIGTDSRFGRNIYTERTVYWIYGGDERSLFIAASSNTLLFFINPTKWWFLHQLYFFNNYYLINIFILLFLMLYSDWLYERAIKVNGAPVSFELLDNVLYFYSCQVWCFIRCHVLNAMLLTKHGVVSQCILASSPGKCPHTMNR